jgi:chemotaxis protein MotB
MDIEPEFSGEHQRNGSWKVAYADFVTALMALFIVLWLMTASPDVQREVASYFKSPRGVAGQAGTGMGGSGQGLAVTKNNVKDLKARIEKAIQDSPALRHLAPHMQFSVTGEGLRIEMMETSGGMFFESGSQKPTVSGSNLFGKLANELGQLPNPVVIEGHTDSRPFRDAGKEAYGNWELSFDRANMARRIMLDGGLQPDRVSEIRGYADRQPITNNTLDNRNRRVSVILQFNK